MKPPRRHTTIALGSCAAVVVGLGALLAASCSPAPAADPDRRKVSDEAQLEMDKKFVRDPFEDQARQGILRERTIREMHFEPNSARLTPLGRKNVAILADAVREDGGTISVQRGAADAALYAGRVAEVRRQLTAAGIAKDRFAIEDGAAGGAGMPTATALEIRKNIKKTPLPSSTGQILDPRAGTTGASNGGTP